MRRARILILAVAAVSAIALAFMVRAMVSRPAPAPAVIAAAPSPDQPMAKVLVARRDLPIGAKLSEQDMHWQAWPADAVNAAFVTDGSVATPQPAAATAGEKAAGAVQAAADATQEMLSGSAPIEALVGAIVKEPILANEPITDRKLVRSGESGYMAVVLQPGMRAIAVPVSVETAAGGFILPGDRVDLIQSRQAQGSATGTAAVTADTVMTNVRVLAIDQTTTVADGAQAVVGAVATLEVSPEDAEGIAQARKEGELSLALRSYADVGGPSGRVARRKIASGGGVRVWRSNQATTAVAN
jgi:pilus assembly protein CpaB